MKRVLSLVLVLVMVLGTIVPAFAEEATTTAAMTAGEKLENYDVIDGTENGLEEDKPLTRAAMAVVIAQMYGEKLIAMDYAFEPTFTDMVEGEWYIPYVAYAENKGWMIGDGPNTTFRPNDTMNAQEVNVMFLKALGYTDADFTWDETVNSLAADLGFAVDAADPSLVMRGEAFTAVVKALDVMPKDGTEALGTVLDLVNYTAPVVEVPVVDLAVESVTALNLREVEVVYNTEVDATEGVKAANYKIDSNSPEKVTLAEDGKTVVLRMSNANALGNFSNTSDLVIESEVGFDADQTISNFSVKDTTVPEVVSVEVTGPRNLKVTFTEPLDETITAGNTAASFKMDAGAMALDSTVGTYSGRVVTLKTLANLTEGNHTLELVSANNIVDNAAYGAVPSTTTFAFTPDTSEVTVSISASTEKTIDLTFNKAIDPATIVNNANVLVTHTYNTATNQVTGAQITNSGDDQTFTVTFTNPLPPGSTTVYVKYDSATGTLVADNYSNKLAATNIIVETIADLTAPVAESAEFIDATTVRVTFSEAVTSATVTDETNYTLKDAAGDKVSVTGAAFHGTSTKVVNLTTGTINGGAYTLLVEDAKDISVAANEMADTTLTFTASDAVAPTVTDNDSATPGIQVQKIAADKVKVTFSEAMDAAYVTDKNNWQYDNAALLTADTVTMDGTKSVIIKIAANVDDAKAITLARVKDAAGNWIEAFSTALDIEALANIAPTTIKLVNKNTIELYFKNNVISGTVATDLEVSYNGGVAYNVVAVTGTPTTVADGHTTITVNLDTDLTDTEITNVRIRTTAGAAAAGAKNAYGTPVQITTPAGDNTVDYFAPEVLLVTTDDLDTNGQIDTIVVDFTESMYQPSIQDTDFEVAGYTITGMAYTDADTVTLTLKELTTPDTGATPKVTLVGAVQDATAQRNEKASQAAKTSVDGAAPVLLSVAQTAAATATITVSEAVEHVALAVTTDITGTVNAANTPITGVTSAQVLTANATNTILLVGIAPVNVTTETVTYTVNGVGAAKILDAAGNAAATATLTDANGF